MRLKVVARHKLAAGPEPRLAVEHNRSGSPASPPRALSEHLVRSIKKQQKARRHPHPPDAPRRRTSARTRRGNTPRAPVMRVFYLRRPGNAREPPHHQRRRHSRAAGATPRRGALKLMSGARCHFFYEKQSRRRTPAQISELDLKRPRFSKRSSSHHQLRLVPTRGTARAGLSERGTARRHPL